MLTSKRMQKTAAKKALPGMDGKYVYVPMSSEHVLGVHYKGERSVEYDKMKLVGQREEEPTYRSDIELSPIVEDLRYVVQDAVPSQRGCIVRSHHPLSLPEEVLMWRV
jgi:hypothetical protein